MNCPRGKKLRRSHNRRLHSGKIIRIPQTCVKKQSGSKKQSSVKCPPQIISPDELARLKLSRQQAIETQEQIYDVVSDKINENQRLLELYNECERQRKTSETKILNLEAAARNALEEQRNMLEDLKINIRQKEQVIAENRRLAEEVLKTEKKKKENSERVNLLQIELNNLRTQNEEINQQRVDVENALKLIKEETEKQGEEFENSRQQAERVTEELRRKNKRLEAEKLNILRGSVIALQQKESEYKTKQANFMQELNEKVTEKIAEINEYKSKLAESSALNVELNARISDLERQVQELEEEKVRLRGVIEQNQKIIEEQKQQNQSLHRENEQLQIQKQELEDNLNSKTVELERVQGELNLTDGKLRIAERKVILFSSEREEIRIEIGKVLKQIQDKDELLQKANILSNENKENAAREKRELENQLRSLQSNEESLQREFDLQRTELQNVIKEKSKLEDKILELTPVVNQLVEESNQLNETLERAKKEIEISRNVIQHYRTENKELEKRMGEQKMMLLQQTVYVNNQINQMKIQNQVESSGRQQAEYKNRQNEETINQLQTQFDALEREKQEIQDTSENLKAELAAAKAESERLAMENTNLLTSLQYQFTKEQLENALLKIKSSIGNEFTLSSIKGYLESGEIVESESDDWGGDSEWEDWESEPTNDSDPDPSFEDVSLETDPEPSFEDVSLESDSDSDSEFETIEFETAPQTSVVQGLVTKIGDTRQYFSNLVSETDSDSDSEPDEEVQEEWDPEENLTDAQKRFKEQQKESESRKNFLETIQRARDLVEQKNNEIVDEIFDDYN
jgi:hypothetical protein